MESSSSRRPSNRKAGAYLDREIIHIGCAGWNVPTCSLCVKCIIIQNDEVVGR